MSENMVERVARAIFDSLQGDVHTGGWDFGTGDVNVSAETKERYRSMARAAIEAMAEPTEAMIHAAAETPGMSAVNAVMGLHQARGYGFKAGSFDAGSPLHQAWQAMITAALKP